MFIAANDGTNSRKAVGNTIKHVERQRYQRSTANNHNTGPNRNFADTLGVRRHQKWLFARRLEKLHKCHYVASISG